MLNMEMKRFKPWLTEGFSSSSANKVDSLIKSYLEKKIGEKFTKMPGVEEFSNNIESGYGIRYFYGTKSVRFNWKSSINVMSLHSVDLWDGHSIGSSKHIEFAEDSSIVKMLPTIVDIMLNPGAHITFAIPVDDLKEDVQLIAEAKSLDVWEEVIIALKNPKNVGVKYWDIINGIGSRSKNIISTIREMYPDAFEKDGRTILYTGKLDIDDVISRRNEIIDDVGGVQVKITNGFSKEEYRPSKQIEALETEGLEQLSYEEQVHDLSVLLKLLVRGVSNALWVAGRGGTGKSHTIERGLAEAGLRDGAGYFKNSGSSSAIGIYKLLFKYQNDIILFDDSDGSLADQDSRNLLKAATDTKSVRKLVWNKDSKNMADPDEIDPEDETDTRIPKYFEFKGKIIFISNLPINKLDPDGALRTRGLMIDINPSDEEILNFMKKIVDSITLKDNLELDHDSRLEVIDILTKNTRGRPDLRKLERALNIRAGLGNTSDVERMLRLYA